MTLGERIREQRKARGMSQEMVAGHLGVSRQAVAKWENGQSAPRAENLHRLAELLDTTAGSLLDSPAVGSGTAEQACALLRAERKAESGGRRGRRRRSGWRPLPGPPPAPPRPRCPPGADPPGYPCCR